MSLALVSLSRSTLTALGALDLIGARRVSGLPLPAGFLDDATIWAMYAGRLGTMPHAAGWLVHAMVRSDGVVVGHAGFHLPPQDGVVELGYTVFEAYRRRGHAIDAVGQLLDRARREPDVSVVRACVSPANAASLAVVARCGFEDTGEVVDDEVDGPERVFVHRLGD